MNFKFQAWNIEEVDMNGFFNELLNVKGVTGGVAVGSVLFGRKVVVPFLLLVAVCFVGGFTAKAQAQTVKDAVQSFRPLSDQESSASPEEMKPSGVEFGFADLSSLGVSSDSPPPAPAPKCLASNSVDRIRNKLGFC